MGDHGARQLSPLFRRRAVRWDPRAGVYRVELSEEARQTLRSLMEQFLQILAEPDSPALHRLFPPAYSDPAHVAQQEEYRRLMQEDLVEHRREECRTVMDNAERTELTEEQLLAWTRAINSVRLVLGTLLDVSEDDTPQAPRTGEEWAYQWLSLLLEEAIEAMSRQT